LGEQGLHGVALGQRRVRVALEWNAGAGKGFAEGVGLRVGAVEDGKVR
jgi:hypothetical protein